MTLPILVRNVGKTDDECRFAFLWYMRLLPFDILVKMKVNLKPQKMVLQIDIRFLFRDRINSRYSKNCRMP